MILKLNRGNECISKHNINVSCIPYTIPWKNEILFIIAVLFKTKFLHNEIVRIIELYSLNILKTICIGMSNIDISDICPCTEQKCLLEWFSYFKESYSFSYKNLFHCAVTEKKQCHYIGYRKGSNTCFDCKKYCCDKCSENKVYFLICNSCKPSRV